MHWRVCAAKPGALSSFSTTSLHRHPRRTGMDKSTSNNDPSVEIRDRDENSGVKHWDPGKKKANKGTKPLAAFRGVQVPGSTLHTLVAASSRTFDHTSSHPPPATTSISPLEPLCSSHTLPWP